MTSRQRMRTAMARGTADRVPAMCQLSLGHYFLHAGLSPFEIWFTSAGFAEALIRLQRRYRFDGILINLPGRPPDIRDEILRIERGEAEDRIRWRNGGAARLPHDDNAHYIPAPDHHAVPPFAEIDPERLFYVEPWDATGINYPFTWDFEPEPRPERGFFPPYVLDTIRTVVARAGADVSVHSEVFSPFSQLLELLGYENALIALLEEAPKAHACLERLTTGAVALARRQASCGVDAVLISSAFAGAGFVSRDHYRQFVLPYEKRLVSEVKKTNDVFVYTHTCGAIGDRLDLMVETGTDGIDTLDPPPLGTVELDQAKTQLAGKVFIKGNIDPVNTLLNGSDEQFDEDVRWRLEVGKSGGGYILSSACSVAPRVRPDRLELLANLADQYGRY
jgi:hypothetical protein